MDLFLGRQTSAGELALGKYKIPEVTKADGWTAVLCHFYGLTTCPWINKSRFMTDSSRLTPPGTATFVQPWFNQNLFMTPHLLNT